MRVVWRGIGIAVTALGLLAAAAGAAPVSVGHSGWFWGTPLPQGNSLRSVDFAGQRGYAVGDFGTMLRTDDGGSTWSGVSTGVTVDLTRVRLISPDSMVAGGGCTVRRSDDGGRSFRRLPWTASDRRCSSSVAAFAFPTGGTGYLLLNDGNLLRSDDGGATWGRRTAVPGTRAARGGTQPNDIVFLDTELGFASTNSGYLYKTVDGGSTWTPVIADYYSALTGISFPDRTTGYVVGNGGTILKTSDGGDNWDFAYFDDVTNLASIDCADPSTCLAIASSGSQLLRTVDGGGSWTSVTPSTERIFTVAFASTERAAALGAAGVSVLSNDSGGRFSRVGGRLVGDYTGVRASSAQVAYAFGRGGSLAKTLDGGTSWRSIDVATPDDVVDVWFPTTQVGFALDTVGQFLRTDNGGVSWRILDTGTSASPLGVLALDTRRVILVGPTGLRVSTNGGGDFTPNRQKKVLEAPLFHLDAIGQTVFAFGARNIFVSSNGGLRWRSVNRPVKKLDIEDVDFVTSRLGYVLDEAGRVWKTADRGRHWRYLPAVGSEQGSDLAMADPRHGWIAISEFGDDDSGYVLRTSDGGRSFRPQLIGRGRVAHEGLQAPSAVSGFALTAPNLLFGTTTGGDRGTPTELRLSITRRRPGRPGTLKIDGTLNPAEGGERVVVSMRPVGTPEWSFETVQVASNGRFTVVADVQRTTEFVAQWSGDDTRLGDGSTVLSVPIKKRKPPRTGRLSLAGP